MVHIAAPSAQSSSTSKSAQQQQHQQHSPTAATTSTTPQQEQWISKACSFQDVLDLARSKEGFRLASSDDKHQIRMFTKVVAESPIQLMKASTVMPCTPRDFLRYLDMDVRSLWDEHFVEGVVLRELTREAPPQQQHQHRAATTSSALGSPLAEEVLASSSSSCVCQRGGGKVKVQLKHIGFLSPIPFLQNRDFELVIAEHYCPQCKVAVLKAFSPPAESVVPLRPSEYVRGIVGISGFVAEPLRYREPRFQHAEVEGCRVTYVALVHPMGLIPPFLVNQVVGKQTSAMVLLQDFIAANSLKDLQARGVITAAEMNSGSKCGEVMYRRHTPPTQSGSSLHQSGRSRRLFSKL
ncbi:Hypothetical protein, putative [Bodo saltans]|uniref:START domain-containing protein n=1 Tax=Bodo saltans TaxID=75058 RepID=A0A0S4IT02_BODSA|nr:Hypothetical protein, putative [Bodo saltans]|eukprot:CUG06297.1 Hypothetical protein, putative [Bodo saltans]